MASARPSILIHRIAERVLGRSAASEGAFWDIEERHRKVTAAAEQWHSLLREMEHSGHSGEARYEAYYQAYMRTKQQQKRLDLELFNLRQRLTG